MKRRLLRDPDPPASGAASAANQAPPPAAATVIGSAVSEGDAGEIVKLKRDLDDERAGRKKDQTRLSELEDENRRLKTPPAPAPAPEKRSWLEGATLLG